MWFLDGSGFERCTQSKKIGGERIVIMSVESQTTRGCDQWGFMKQEVNIKCLHLSRFHAAAVKKFDFIEVNR